MIYLYPENALIFGCMVVLTGLTETVTGIDTILKIEALIEDMPQDSEQQLFRSHLVAATAGSFVAYFCGGYVFQAGGVLAVCQMGMGVSVLNCFVLLVYCLKRPAFCRGPLVTVDALLSFVEKAE